MDSKEKERVRLIEGISVKDEDYTELLASMHVEFISAGDYLQIGSAPKEQIWILELSVVHIQLDEFISVVLPVLVSKGCVFRMPSSRSAAYSIIVGRAGKGKFGKVFSVGVLAFDDLINVAFELVEITKSFRSADVYECSLLGGTVFAHFGSWYSWGDGTKMFHIPDNTQWPFSSLAAPIFFQPDLILNKAFRSAELIKSNYKGNVLKAFFYKSLLNMGVCLIKEGRRNTFIDESGRDNISRLAWQYQVHQKLEGLIPIPKALDFFVERDNGYLAMKFMKGKTLSAVIADLYRDSSFRSLTKSDKIFLSEIAMMAIGILEVMHGAGIMHRDLSPENFLLVGKKLYVIDMELAYDFKNSQPFPPFEWGTPGFRDPMRFRGTAPVIEDDIYGLGALISLIFTNVPPLKLDAANFHSLEEKLFFFTGSADFAKMIAECFNPDMLRRPSLVDIKTAVSQYKMQFSEKEERNLMAPDPVEVRNVINMGLSYMSDVQAVSQDGIWVSKFLQQRQVDAKSMIVIGFKDGIMGCFSLLGKAKQLGYDIGPLKYTIQTNWDYVHLNCLKMRQGMPGGLFSGGAGIALVLSDMLKNTLLDGAEVGNYIRPCMEIAVSGNGLADGISGKGLAIILCLSWLDEYAALQQLNDIIEKLIITQHVDGYWLPDGENGGERSVSFSDGTAGVVYFLCRYLQVYSDKRVQMVVEKAVSWLIGNVYKVSESVSLAHGLPGVVLALLKAYEATGIPLYRDSAEKWLLGINRSRQSARMGYEWGDAGLGDVYLEAWRILGNSEFKDRADGLVCYLMRTYKKKDESCCWLQDDGAFPSVNLFNGNGGILYFLMRYLNPEQLPGLITVG